VFEITVDNSNKIVAIVSGGLDSSTMLWHLASQDYNVLEVLTFNYGQRHSKETTFAKQIVTRFQEKFGPVHHQIVDITSIGNLIAKGSLTGKEDVPHDMYTSETQRSTIVPNRNMIFLSIAAGRALTIGANYIGYAAHASDYSVYPDCRPEFIEQMDKVIQLGNLWDSIHLVAPFQHKTKANIVQIGHDLHVPYEMTWSCYEGLDRPCLECGTCVERAEAFSQNNLIDPTLTKDEWRQALQHLNSYSA
jgi:7-cyano-7-deazaguanine synthase